MLSSVTIYSQVTQSTNIETLRDRLLDLLMQIYKYRKSLFLLSHPYERPGCRVNWGQCGAPKNSATKVEKKLRNS